MCVCVYVYVCVCMYMYVCVYVCVCVCVCVWCVCACAKRMLNLLLIVKCLATYSLFLLCYAFTSILALQFISVSKSVCLTQ